MCNFRYHISTACTVCKSQAQHLRLKLGITLQCIFLSDTKQWQAPIL